MSLNVFLFLISSFTFLSPYFMQMTWWKFAIATVVILLCYRKISPDSYRKILGIELNSSQVLKSLGLLIFIALGSAPLLDNLVNGSGVSRTPIPLFSMWFFQPVFQALNEELITRGAAFYFLKRFMKREWVMSLLVTVLFVAYHVWFFWIHESVLFSWITIFSLFFATLAMNNVFFHTGNIGITYAIHAGWNYQKFGAEYRHLHNGNTLLDGEKFNLVEGTLPILLISVTLYFVTLYLRRQWHRAILAGRK